MNASTSKIIGHLTRLITNNEANGRPTPASLCSTIVVAHSVAMRLAHTWTNESGQTSRRLPALISLTASKYLYVVSLSRRRHVVTTPSVLSSQLRRMSGGSRLSPSTLRPTTISPLTPFEVHWPSQKIKYARPLTDE